MQYRSRTYVIGFVFVTASQLSASISSADAAQCKGYKIVQQCTQPFTTTNMGACPNPADPNYASCSAINQIPTGPQTCTPVKVPCDYPANIFDAISRIFNP